MTSSSQLYLLIFVSRHSDSSHVIIKCTFSCSSSPNTVTYIFSEFSRNSHASWSLSHSYEYLLVAMC